MKNIKNILIILIVAFAISGLFNDSFKMFNSPLAVMGNIVDDNVIVIAAIETKTYETTAKLGTLPVVTKQCATFNGWWTAKDTGGTQVTADTLVSSLGSVRTLYARWTDAHTISYTKTATTHSGTCSVCSTTYTAETHTWETTTAATCTTAGSKKCTVCNTTADIAATGHSGNPCTTCGYSGYCPGGVNDSTCKYEKTCEHGTFCSVHPYPDVANDIGFCLWCEEHGLISAHTSNYTTCYAKGTCACCGVYSNYLCQGDSRISSDLYCDACHSECPGTDEIGQTFCSCCGEAFVGLTIYDTCECTGVTYRTVNGKKVWSCTEHESVTLTYELAGGTGGPSSQTVYKNGGGLIYDTTVSTTKPTKEGYTFEYWDQTGYSSNTYNPGDSIRLSGYTTLEAVWKEIPKTYYTVRYDANGGYGELPATETVVAGSTITVKAPTSIQNSGMDFDGWSDTKVAPYSEFESTTSHNIYYEGTEVTVNSNITFYALWFYLE